MFPASTVRPQFVFGHQPQKLPHQIPNLEALEWRPKTEGISNSEVAHPASDLSRAKPPKPEASLNDVNDAWLPRKDDAHRSTPKP